MKKAINILFAAMLVLTFISIISTSCFAVRASVGGARAFINAELDGQNPFVMQRVVSAINENPYEISASVQTDPEFEKYVRFEEPTKVNISINQTYEFKYNITIDYAGNYSIPILVGFDGNNSQAGIAAEIKVLAYCAEGVDPKLCEKEIDNGPIVDIYNPALSPIFLILIGLGILIVIGILLYIIFGMERKKWTEQKYLDY